MPQMTSQDGVYLRFSRNFSTTEVFEKIKSNDKGRIKLEGFNVKCSSLRIKTFFHKGIKCAHCGLEASFFAVERMVNDKGSSVHMNLYGIQDGQEVLFTHDHIYPRAHGGLDSLENTQTMCGPCNWAKKDTIIDYSAK